MISITSKMQASVIDPADIGSLESALEKNNVSISRKVFLNTIFGYDVLFLLESKPTPFFINSPMLPA